MVCPPALFRLTSGSATASVVIKPNTEVIAMAIANRVLKIMMASPLIFVNRSSLVSVEFATVVADPPAHETVGKPWALGRIDARLPLNAHGRSISDLALRGLLAVDRS
jgi:hypothetical protein